MISPIIEDTDDGSQTLIHPILGERYHSTRGAVGESRHIFIDGGFNVNTLSFITILEVGFGSGLNALLTAHEAQLQKRNVLYYALELYPIDKQVIDQLSYASDQTFLALHQAEWGIDVEINRYFRLKKMEQNLKSSIFDSTFDLVYFDAFAPDTQPDLWSQDIFMNIYSHMNIGGVLVTYSAKGSVKETLRSVGFEVKRLPGALGKRHMIRATKV